MRAVRIIRNGCQVSPTLGELLVASAEALSLGRKESNETKKDRLVFAAGWLFIEVQRYLRRVGHPTPDAAISHLDPLVSRVLTAKRALDEEIDRQLAAHRGRDGHTRREIADWPNPSEDA